MGSLLDALIGEVTEFTSEDGLDTFSYPISYYHWFFALFYGDLRLLFMNFKKHGFIL